MKELLGSLELNRIYQMDCLEGMKLIPDKSIDSIICDLPYGTTSCSWDTIVPFDKLWEQYERIIKDNGAIVLFGVEPFSSNLRMSNIKMYRHEWIWNKEIGANFVQAKKHPLKVTENIIVFSKKTVNYYPQMIQRSDEETKILKAKNKKSDESKKQKVDDKYFKMASGRFEVEKDEKLAYPKNILTFNKFAGECNSKKRVHPTQKPIKLLEYLLKTYTKEIEIVLDNCMGSGSLAVAALKNNRRFIGFETESKYIEIANQRIESTYNELDDEKILNKNN